MKTYYGVYSVGDDNTSIWMYVGSESECMGICAFNPELMYREVQGEVDEVWAIRADVARAWGDVEPVIYEDDELIGPTKGEDKEKDIDEHAWIFEKYIGLSRAREPYQQAWEKLRYARSTWWSLFKEEMDWAWLELDVFDRKAHHYLSPVNPKGIVALHPVDAEIMVNKIVEARKKVVRRCEALQSQRKSYTYGIYQRCMKINDKCRAFWKTKEGIALTNLNQERSDYWEMIKDLTSTWEDYNSLVNREINPYWTSGETEEVDDMTLSLPTYYEYLDILEDSHNQEMNAMDRGPSLSIGYWDFTQKNSPVYAIDKNHHTVVGPNGATQRRQENAAQAEVFEEEWSEGDWAAFTEYMDRE
jgi:hypothetical protein